MRKRLALMGAAMLVVGCTDTQWAELGSIGEPHMMVHLTNVGDTLATYRCTGIPSNEGSSDGYKCASAASGEIVRISGGIVTITPIR
jgi:hypothetical protein